jgi:hypothetical protein
MTGLNKFPEKEKRQMRIKNHIAKDRRTPKYRQRKVERKKIKDDDDWLTDLDEL